MEKISQKIMFTLGFPKKCHLGPQNGFRSLGPRKLAKIVKCAIMKDTQNMKAIVVGVQVE